MIRELILVTLKSLDIFIVNISQDLPKRYNYKNKIRHIVNFNLNMGVSKLLFYRLELDYSINQNKCFDVLYTTNL